jgi:inorganic pyrophosphatase
VILVVTLNIWWADSEKPFADKSISHTLLFRIEIPAGTKQKWEFNDETGEIEKDYKDEKERIIQFLPYPGNYGFIPETLAGDGDPIDVIDLDESEQRGALNFEDKKEEDLLICFSHP